MGISSLALIAYRAICGIAVVLLVLVVLFAVFLEDGLLGALVLGVSTAFAGLWWLLASGDVVRLPDHPARLVNDEPRRLARLHRTQTMLAEQRRRGDLSPDLFMLDLDQPEQADPFDRTVTAVAGD